MYLTNTSEENTMKSTKRVATVPHIFRWGVAAIAVLVVALIGAAAKAQNTPTINLETILSFLSVNGGWPSGRTPKGAVVEVSPGIFFATTSDGGLPTSHCAIGSGNCGAIVKIDTTKSRIT